MIVRAEVLDIERVTKIAMELWQGHDFEELEKEIESHILSENVVIYLAIDDDKPIGFAQCQLRTDYVEGTSSSPVGYLEGIYVNESSRKKGIAKELMESCEKWAKEKGCIEFASDCELTNNNSLKFHLSMGFKEANRVICFTKKL